MTQEENRADSTHANRLSSERTTIARDLTIALLWPLRIAALALPLFLIENTLRELEGSKTSVRIAVAVPILAAFVVVLAFVIALVKLRVQRRDIERARQRIAKLEQPIAAAVNDQLGRAILELSPSQRSQLSSALLAEADERLRAHHGSPDLAMNEAQKAVEAFKQRLERPEERLAPEGRIPQTWTVNDAILATRLDALDRTVQRIEGELVKRWDVAQIVFAVLTGLATLTGAVLAALAYLKP